MTDIPQNNGQEVPPKLFRAPKRIQVKPTQDVEKTKAEIDASEQNFDNPSEIHSAEIEHRAAVSFNDSSSEKSEENFLTQVKLAKTITVLKEMYDVVFDQYERPEEQKSQAQKNDELRYAYLKEHINSFVTQYDSKILGEGANYQQYLKFEEELSKQGKGPDINNIMQFKESLVNLDQPLENNTFQGNATSASLYMRRKAVGFVAGFFLKPEDVARLDSLPKEKKEKIKLIEQFIKIAGDNDILPEEKEEAYKKINSDFRELTKKETRRRGRELVNIIAKQTQRGQLFTVGTLTQIGEAITHPITKIIKNENLTGLEKATGLATTIAKKTADGISGLVEKVPESGQFLVKHSVKQPLMIVHRSFMSGLNAVEYLYAQGQALAEEDPEQKIELQKEADRKLANLGYDGEKLIRAAAASVGVAVLDIAAFSSFGAQLPLGGIAGHTAQVGLGIAVNVVDNLQNARDVIENVTSIQEKVNQKQEKFADTIHARRRAIVPESEALDLVVGNNPSQKQFHKKTSAVVPEEVITGDLNEADTPPQAKINQEKEGVTNEESNNAVDTANLEHPSLKKALIKHQAEAPQTYSVMSLFGRVNNRNKVMPVVAK